MTEYLIITPKKLNKYKTHIQSTCILWNIFNSENISPNQLIRRIKTADSFLILAIDQNETVTGFAAYSSIRTPLDDNNRIEIYALFTIGSKRKTGIGMNLITQIIIHGKSIGCHGLHVTGINGGLYKKMGFKKYEISGRYFKKI